MRVVRRNPFLTIGLAGLLAFVAWVLMGAPDSGAGRILLWTWRVFAAPLHAAANLLAPMTDGWPEVLDAAAAVFLGLLPWALADVMWRRARRRQIPHPEQDRTA